MVEGRPVRNEMPTKVMSTAFPHLMHSRRFGFSTSVSGASGTVTRSIRAIVAISTVFTMDDSRALFDAEADSR